MWFGVSGNRKKATKMNQRILQETDSKIVDAIIKEVKESQFVALCPHETMDVCLSCKGIIVSSYLCGNAKGRRGSVKALRMAHNFIRQISRSAALVIAGPMARKYLSDNNVESKPENIL